MTSRYVWEITTRGGDPAAIQAAVNTGIDLLRGPRAVAALSPDGPGGIDEQACWREDVSAVSVGEVAVDGDRASLLIDVDLHDQGSIAATTAAMMTAGIETAVFDAVMAVDGVTAVSTSDRVARP